jgi:predicted kinase
MPGAVVVRSDVERKTLFGAGETAKLAAAAYAPEVTARVYGAIADKARRVVAAGHSAIVDAVFASPQERDALAAAAQAAKVPLQGLFLTADLATRIARVGGRTEDASDADAAVVQAQQSYDLGTLTWPKIDASGSVAENLGRARAALSADL